MNGSASKETQGTTPIGVDTRIDKTINQPTSPEQIHNSTVLQITSHLRNAGYQAAPEKITGEQRISIPPNMTMMGVEPSGGEMSTKDVIRAITEERPGVSEGERRVGTVSGKDALQLRIGRESRLLRFLKGLKKAA